MQLWNQLRLELKNQSQRQVMIHSYLHITLFFFYNTDHYKYTCK